MEPIGLDLDSSLRAQPGLLSQLAMLVDLRDMGQGLRVMSSERHVSAFRERIAQLRSQRPGNAEGWLTFYGSGDFHYLTEVLLATLPESVGEFSVVQIDNHPDWFCNPPRYHCGNWVARALRMKRIESVSLIGQDSPDLMWFKTWTTPMRSLRTGRLTMHPRRIRTLAFPLMGRRMEFDTTEQLGAVAVFERVAERLAGKAIYISVDKDVLAGEFGASDWERGGMTLAELVGGLKILREKCNVIGADVCGESSPEALRGLWKRIDAGRVWGGGENGDGSKNEGANLAILKAITGKGT